MKKYRDHLDRIKCSPEFKAEMERLLSEDSTAEYADSVSEVERVTGKPNFHRWTAAAASLVLLLGIGGGVFLMRAPDVPSTSSESSEEPSETTQVERISQKPDLKSLGNAEISVTSFDEAANKSTADFGRLPDEINAEIIELLDSEEFAPAEKEEIPDNMTYIKLVWDDGTQMWIPNNGVSIVAKDGKRQFYTLSCVDKIKNVLLVNIRDLDWYRLIPDENGSKTLGVFSKYADEIERVDDIEDVPDVSFTFFENGMYKVSVNGDSYICAAMSEGGEPEYVIYKVPEQMCLKLAYIFGFELEVEQTSYVDGTVDSDSAELYKLVDADIPDKLSLSLITGTGQFNRDYNFEEADTLELVNAIKQIKWTKSEFDTPVGAMIVAERLFIDSECNIYTEIGTGAKYSPQPGENSAPVINALTDMMKSTELGEIQYLLAASEITGNTVEGSWSCAYTSDEFKTKSVSGSGWMTADMSGKNQTVTFNEGEDYCASFIMTDGIWTATETGSRVKELHDEMQLTTDENGEYIYTMTGGRIGEPEYTYNYCRSRAVSELNMIANDMYRPTKVTVGSLDIEHCMVLQAEWTDSTLELRVDEYGTIVFMKVSNYRGFNKGTELKQYVFGHGDGSGISYVSGS